jgi:hypothetical protein
MCVSPTPPPPLTTTTACYRFWREWMNGGGGWRGKMTTKETETKNRKRCSHGGCTNFAQKGGVCVIHGAKMRHCQNEGCTNKAVKGGVCVTHGANVKRCSFEGCTNKAVKGGVCITHGAKTKRCSFEGCTNKAVKGGVCVTHGANMKQCGPEECKEAQNIGVNTNCKNNCTRLTFNCIHNNPTITREDNCTKPQIDSLFWDGITGDGQIDELFYNEAKIIIASQAVFDHYQNVLKEVKDSLKHVNGFQQNYKWQDTKFTEEYLVTNEFTEITESTIFVTPDSNDPNKYKIIFIFSLEISKLDKVDPLVTLSQYIFSTNGTIRKMRGQTIVKFRGNKAMEGIMGVIGTWCAFGLATQGLGRGVKQVRAYKPNENEDKEGIRLYQEHAKKLSDDERRLSPACFQARMDVMNNADPNKQHRISNDCNATAISVSKGYVTVPHDDSGIPSNLEFIKFINNGNFEANNKWQFVIAGCLIRLPSSSGNIALIGLPAAGVYHGTLPTKRGDDNILHSGIGSALISKREVILGMIHQKNPTPSKFCASSIFSD